MLENFTNRKHGVPEELRKEIWIGMETKSTKAIYAIFFTEYVRG